MSRTQYFDLPDYNDPTRQSRCDQLEQQITELAANINAATCRLLELLVEFDREWGWGASGCLSCAHWLNWRCGISLGAAREKVRVSHALEEVPKIHAAFSAGEISYSKVRALTRVAHAENEDYLLIIARHGTAAHMETLVSKFGRVKRLQKTEQAWQQQREQSLQFFFDEQGMLCVKGRLAPEQAAVFMKAIETSMRIGDESDTKISAENPLALQRARALFTLADTYLAGDKPVRSNGDRYQVVVHVNADALRKDGDTDVSTVEDGPEISAETSRRIACDASIVPVLESSDGEILNIGRKTRSIPPAIRRALKLRDQGCKFPGCTRKHYVEGHHITHWGDGGETSLRNLVTLCTAHHAMVHEGGFSVTEDNGTFVFKSPQDRGIEQQPAMPPPKGELITDSIQKERFANRNPATWDGTKMDYPMAIDSLLFAEQRFSSRVEPSGDAP